VLKSLYKKIVLAVTSLFCGASGTFLLAGIGSPGLKVMSGLIFLVSFLNLSLYVNDYYKDFKKQVAYFFPPPAKSEGGGQGGAKADREK